MKNEHALLRKILGGERKRLRHHVTATVTEEGQWEQPEANNGLARMFVIMLLLHIVVIGAIVLYDFVGEEESPHASPAVAAHSAGAPARAHANAPVAAAIPVTPEQAQAAAATSAATSPEFDVYEVKAGDTVASVIASHQVDQAEFLRINSLPTVDAAIETNSILRIPKNKVPATAVVTTPADEPAPVSPASAATSVVAEPPAPALASNDPPGLVSIPIIPPTAEELAAASQPAASSTPADEPATPAATTVVTKEQPPAAPEKPKPVTLTQPRPVPTPSEMQKKPIVKQDPPAPRKTEKTDSTPKTAAKSSAKGGSHTLAKGETLYRVAMKHGVTVNDIIRANNIKDPAKLRDGTRLVIPAK